MTAPRFRVVADDRVERLRLDERIKLRLSVRDFVVALGALCISATVMISVWILAACLGRWIGP